MGGEPARRAGEVAHKCRGTLAEMNQLPTAWKDALARVARSRSSRIHMPTALLVALDMVEAGEAPGGSIEFLKFESRFKALMKRVRPNAANTAWAPFYHLSTKSGLWDLYLGDEKADFSEVSGSPKSRSRVLKRADRAMLSGELVSGLSNPGTIQTIRDSVYELLRKDDDSDSETLIRLHSTV